MHRVGDGFPKFMGAEARPSATPASKPDLRILAEDGTPLIIRWTPNGPECDYRGMVSPETARRIQAAMRREWLLGVDKTETQVEGIAEEQRRHQKQHRRDTRYPRIGSPVGHWTDGLGVLAAQWPAICRLCGEPWERGERIAWHRLKGPFHLECAKHARDHKLPEPATSKFRKRDAPLPPWPPPGESPHFTDRWRLLRARRSATCNICGAVIAVGEPILWSPNDEQARHHACGLFLREVDDGHGSSDLR